MRRQCFTCKNSFEEDEVSLCLECRQACCDNCPLHCECSVNAVLGEQEESQEVWSEPAWSTVYDREMERTQADAGHLAFLKKSLVITCCMVGGFLGFCCVALNNTLARYMLQIFGHSRGATATLSGLVGCWLFMTARKQLSVHWKSREVYPFGAGYIDGDLLQEAHRERDTS